MALVWAYLYSRAIPKGCGGPVSMHPLDACNTGPLAAPVHQLGRPMDLHDAMQPVPLKNRQKFYTLALHCHT